MIDSRVESRVPITTDGVTEIGAAIARLLVQECARTVIAAQEEVEALIAAMVPDVLELMRCRLQSRNNLPVSREFAIQLLSEDSATKSTSADLSTMGSPILTPREYEVLCLLAKRQSDKHISRALNVGIHTVKWHLKNLYSKLNANSRAYAVYRARVLGILQKDPENHFLKTTTNVTGQIPSRFCQNSSP